MSKTLAELTQPPIDFDPWAYYRKRQAEKKQASMPENKAVEMEENKTAAHRVRRRRQENFEQ